MSDLIEKFFKEDLSEAEKTALDQELASSPEAAQRFGELAEQAYNRFGLPEPKWAGPEELKKISKSNPNAWLWPFGLLFALFGLYCWFYFQKANTVSETTDKSIGSTADGPAAENLVNSEHKPHRVTVKAVTSQQPIIVAQVIPTRMPSQSVINYSTLSLPPVTPKFTPVNVDQNPNHPFSALAVQLHLTSVRSLAVRVLDANGNELVPLFNGSLNTGNWSFEWNGLLKNGQLASPGKYKIEVRAGSYVQTKEVLIQK